MRVNYSLTDGYLLNQAEGAATRPGVSATEASGVQGLGRGLERHRAAAQGDDGHEGRRHVHFLGLQRLLR